MHNFRFILLIALSIHTTFLFSQSNIKGMVCDADGMAILNANVVLWHDNSTSHKVLTQNMDSY